MHKLAKFSENPGKVHFESLVHLLRYTREIKTLGLKYYADMNDAQVSDLFRKYIIKTENHLVGKIIETLAEVQEHELYFIKVVQLTMAHMFQD